MLDVDWSAHEADGAVLVATVVENETPVDRRVRVRSRLDGPVLPPRRGGVPEAGWSGGEYEGVVPASGRLALGFASRGEATDPPVEVVDAGRVETGCAAVGAGTGRDAVRATGTGRDGAVGVGTGRDGAGRTGAGNAPETVDGPTPTDLLRDLGSPTPPREAVPRPDEASPDATVPDRDGGSSAVPRVPEAVATWLDAVAGRVGDGTITPAEEAALRAVADRAASLAGRCAAREGRRGAPEQEPA